eukprot:gb/GECG01002124.1/.p1 GENE.gb/GECG01002124.1/~~gb/GECG01002124.1/.p1  ORF type:complete len:560 (+),score=55.71 gb/GECG01002124.1/:1-1680(+)
MTWVRGCDLFARRLFRKSFRVYTSIQACPQRWCSHGAAISNATATSGAEESETTRQRFLDIYQDPHMPSQDPLMAWMQYFYRTQHVQYANIAFRRMLELSHSDNDPGKLFAGRNQLQNVVFWSHVLTSCNTSEQIEKLYNDLRMTLAEADLSEDRTIECMEGMLRMLHLASRHNPQAGEIRERLQPIFDDIADRVHQLGLTDVHVTEDLGLALDDNSDGSGAERGLESARRRVNSVWPQEHGALGNASSSEGISVQFWPNPALPNAEQAWMDSVLSEEVPSWAMSTYHYFTAKTLREQKSRVDSVGKGQSVFNRNLASAKIIVAEDIVNAWWSDFFGSGNPSAISSITDVASLWTEFDEEYSLQHVLMAGDTENLPTEISENPAAALKFMTASYAFRTLATYCQYHPAVYEAIEAQILRLGDVYSQHVSEGTETSQFSSELSRPFQFLMKYRQLFLERRLAGLRWSHNIVRSAIPNNIPSDLQVPPESLGPLLEQSIKFAELMQDTVGGDRTAFTPSSLVSPPKGADTTIPLSVRVATGVPPVTRSIFEGNTQNTSIQL